MVQRILHQSPETRITWIIGKVEYQLVGDLPGVEFIVFDKQQGRAAYQQIRQCMKGRQFDALFVMQVALRANLIARLIPAKLKFGFDWHRSKELHWLFANTRIAAQQHAHVLEGFMAFADAIGIEPMKPPTWQIPVSDEDNDWAREQAEKLGVFAIISPAASKAERNWLPERYAAVADYLAEHQMKVVLCGGPGKLDAGLRDEIVKHTSNIAADFVGKTSLKQMLALIRQASLVVAPDTGPAHMATTVGTPVVGLYAHSNPRRTGPYLSLDNVVSVYDELILEQKGKPWQSLPWGTRAKGEDLMSRISTQQVIARIDQVLKDMGR